MYKESMTGTAFNPLNAELNHICHLLTLLGAHHILHVSRVRVKQPQVYSQTCIITCVDMKHNSDLTIPMAANP